MPTVSSLLQSARVHMHFPEPQKQCSCHLNDPPPWTGEIHGLSQALLSETTALKVFWWIVMVVCIICGSVTTTLVILEYVEGPTATSTTIRLVESLELPAITICPKVPDALNATGIFGDIRVTFPEIDNATALDLVR
ncbi:hypothetical protein GCK32_018902 [Trichostrongylus colubriformis]|uniref:Uncharacterized protein n=1 Tax=Trichostrongylus colubriformis TaxID=6319 RepID=A0AAN8IXP0_TRICO